MLPATLLLVAFVPPSQTLRPHWIHRPATVQQPQRPRACALGADIPRASNIDGTGSFRKYVHNKLMPAVGCPASCTPHTWHAHDIPDGRCYLMPLPWLPVLQNGPRVSLRTRYQGRALPGPIQVRLLSSSTGGRVPQVIGNNEGSFGEADQW